MLVLTVKAQAGGLATARSYSGEIRARYETPLAFRIPGRLAKRYAHLGDAVKAGAVLAELDPADASASLAAAQATVVAAQNRFTLATQTQERNAREAREDLVSRADSETAEANLAVARADLDAAKAQLALAHNQEQYTKLLAEHDGLITSENAEAGAVLAAGQPVFGFDYAGARDAIIDVPEDAIAAIKPGAAATVSLWSASTEEQSAQVRELAQAADPQSRTYRVRLTLANPTVVRPGMTATVRFADSGATNTVRIRASALFHSGNDTAVWVVSPSEHKLSLRPVAVAGYGATEVSIASGLAAGEEVVSKGVHTVNEGLVVRTAPDTGSGGAP